MGNQRTRVPITFYEGDHYDTVPPPNHNEQQTIDRYEGP